MREELKIGCLEAILEAGGGLCFQNKAAWVKILASGEGAVDVKSSKKIVRKVSSAEDLLVAMRRCFAKTYRNPDDQKDFPEYSESIERNLLHGIKEAYDNGISLIEDANILYTHERYARATSLAILAEEELSKAYLIGIAVFQKRWDREYFNALVVHQNKQAISRGIMELIPEVLRRERQRQRQIVPMRGGISQERVREVVENKHKEHIKKRKLDKQKQDAQFVAISKTGVVCKTPSNITKEMAIEAIDTAVRFQVYPGIMLGIVDDGHPLFRTETKIVTTRAETIIEHESGVDIRMCALDIVDGNQDPNIMNPHRSLFEFKDITAEPTRMTTEQRKLFRQILVSYDGIKQMEKQLGELGLKSNRYLEDCRALVRVSS